jgi:hypothetical protein
VSRAEPTSVGRVLRTRIDYPAAEQAQEQSTVDDIRAVMHKDMEGNVISKLHTAMVSSCRRATDLVLSRS